MVNGSEVELAVSVTGLVEAKAGAPVQVSLSGPNTVNVTVPVGCTAAVSVAAALMTPPAATGADARAVMAGAAGTTTTVPRQVSLSHTGIGAMGGIHIPMSAGSLRASPP